MYRNNLQIVEPPRSCQDWLKYFYKIVRSNTDCYNLRLGIGCLQSVTC